MNEKLIEVEKMLGQWHCQEVYRKTRSTKAIRTVPETMSDAGAGAWMAEASRLIDESLAAQMRAVPR